jgi:hypothetical protein
MNTQTRISIGKAVAIFIGMVIVFATLLVAADRVVGDTLSQLVFVSVGSAVFGSGLTFLLIRVTQLVDDNK